MSSPNPKLDGLGELYSARQERVYRSTYASCMLLGCMEMIHKSCVSNVQKLSKTKKGERKRGRRGGGGGGLPTTWTGFNWGSRDGMRG